MVTRREATSATIGLIAGASGVAAVSSVIPFRARSTVGALPTREQYVTGQLPLDAEIPVQGFMITTDNREDLLRDRFTGHLTSAVAPVTEDNFITGAIAVLPHSYQLRRSYELGSEEIQYTVRYAPYDPGGRLEYHYVFDEWLLREWGTPPERVTVTVGGKADTAGGRRRSG
jgi:hypothetical protein